MNIYDDISHLYCKKEELGNLRIQAEFLGVQETGFLGGEGGGKRRELIFLLKYKLN